MRAQSALDGFDSNANGAIRVIVVQADGKILIGGEFTALAPNSGATVTRNHIARLNPDGNVDATFDPNANGAVYAIAVQPDEKIVVGGNFSGTNSIGGQSRNYIARLDATTGAADSFEPNASLPVFAVVVQSDGRIVVGGLFNGANSIGGQTRNFIARLDAVTGAADSFDPNANSYVSALLVQPNDKIVVGGDFSGANSIGGQTRNRIARLDPVTGLADSFDPNANSTVLSIAQEADGKIIAGGDFSGPNGIGGQTCNFIARLDPVTGAADSFSPNASSVVFAVAVQPDGKILAGGSFTTIGGQIRNHLARLNPVTGLTDSFDPSTSSTVFAIAVQPDNKVLAGGDFISVSPIGGAGVTRNNIARLEIDGRLDQTLNIPLYGLPFAYHASVNSVVFQPDGKFFVSGTFNTPAPDGSRVSPIRLNTDGTIDTTFTYDPASLQAAVFAVDPNGKVLVISGDGGRQPGLQRIRRLNPDGTLDPTFNPGVPNGYYVYSEALQKDNRILIAGDFSELGQDTHRGLARLDPVTGAPDSFAPEPNGDVGCLALQADGRILVGGSFHSNKGENSIGGQPRNYLARLDPVSGLADSLDLNPNDVQGFGGGPISSMAVQADGKVLVSGFFTNIGGQPRNRMARFDASTGLVDSFDPNLINPSLVGYPWLGPVVASMTLQSDGKILVSGSFNNIGGQPRNYIARLDPVTGEPDSFNPGASNWVNLIMPAPDGKILVGSIDVSMIGGQQRINFARLSNDVAALQNLVVAQNAVSWIRGGSSPLLTRATFEYSLDDISYIPIGDGVATGSNWMLSGLNFPTGQNFYVRARGYYSNYDMLKSCRSITESARNAFLFGPTSVVSRKIHGSAGAFDIDLPLIGAPGVECRSGGATGSYQIIFTFLSEVTFDKAVINGGAGSISGVSGEGTETITVNLTGVTNAQTINVGLLDTSNGIDTSNFVVPMSVLLGDTSGNGVVNASDLTKTKGQAGVPLTSQNFRQDVNTSGSINATDIGVVKSMSGTALPPGSEVTALSKRGLVSSPDR